MYVVELFIPAGPGGATRAALHDLRRLLTEKFGGATAFTRAPAEGVWRAGNEEVEKDDIVVVETMVERIDPDFWFKLRRALEARLRQKEILIRAHRVERL